MCHFLKICLSILFLFSIQNVLSDEQSLLVKSTISPLADKSLLLASDQSGGLSVVVGERGHILYSNNNQEWTQASVETRQTLTNVFMLNEKTGWAVGHDAIILKTTDAAKTWRKVFSDVKEEAPLLDIFFKDELNGVAIGAYSLLYVTADGGLSWNKTELNLSDINNKKMEENSLEFTDVFDFHLNDIAYAGEGRFYIATEAGHILRSDDDTNSWQDLASPYHGSFFGVLPLSFNDVLVYGLRGHLYRSSDAGESWQQIESHSKEMLTDAVQLSNGDIVVTGLAGTLLLSNDNGRTFSKIKLQHRHGLSTVVEKEEGILMFAGDAGIQLIPEDSLALGN
jgi:photosystem II stability/assembly factor-like uncharacterized protein